MRRISVVGTTGSGKTTFARDLAWALDAERIELDMLYWGPNWTERPLEIFVRETDAATAREPWVADGNCSKVRPIVWRRADTLVWLDYPIPLVLFRLLRRIFYRSFAGEEILNGDYESLRIHFLSRKSLLVWAAKTHWKHRRDYPAALASPEYAHLLCCACAGRVRPPVCSMWSAANTLRPRVTYDPARERPREHCPVQPQ